MKKTITTTIALALATTIAFAQEKPAAPAAPAATADPVVISAGNIQVRQSEFESAIQSLPPEYQQYASGPGKRQFAEEYIRMKLLAAEGTKAGLEKDPDVVRQLALMRENLVANAQIKKIEQGIAVSDADLKAKYEANKKDYEQVSARHILIAFKGSPAAQPDKPELTEEQAKAKAEALRKEIAGGAKFEDVAKRESDDKGSGANGGDLGAFGRGQMVPEFEKAAFDAKVGELTEVVRTQFGYHVIRVDKHEHTPFEQVKPVLERNEKQVKLQAALDTLKNNAKTTFDAKYFPPETPAQPPAAPAPEKKQ